MADDIEDILKKGEQKTAELQQKLKDAGMEVLQGFSLGGSSVYQWEGEDWRVRRAHPGRCQRSGRTGRAWIHRSSVRPSTF